MNSIKLDSNMTLEDKEDAKEWWLSQKIDYNQKLYIAGVVAFLLYCALGKITTTPEFGFNELDMIFQGFLYLAIIRVASWLYVTGRLIDFKFNKYNSHPFRETLFALQCWFSIALIILFTAYEIMCFLI